MNEYEVKMTLLTAAIENEFSHLIGLISQSTKKKALAASPLQVQHLANVIGNLVHSKVQKMHSLQKCVVLQQ